MKAPISFRMRVTLILLFATIILEALTFFPIFRIDSIVNYELYNYGLQFDLAWANLYEDYLILFLISIVFSIILIVLSIVVMLSFLRGNKGPLKLAEYVIPLAIIGSNIFSVFSLTGILNIVNGTLYSYGLQLSFDWFNPILTYNITVLILISLATISMITTSFFIHFGAREVVTAKSVKRRTETKTRQMQNSELASFILIAAGTAALLTAMFFDSSILAFIGIGLLFWGVLFVYIRKEDYAKDRQMGAIVYQLVDTINEIINELKFQGNPIYLPPKYFKNLGTCKVFISKDKESALPTPEQIQIQESKIFIEKPAGMVVTPPGSELAKILEKTLGTYLAKVDLLYLQQNMPKILIEDLEIAQNFELETENNQIIAKIEYFADKLPQKEKEETRSILVSTLGSAIACALAKTTGCPITIEKQESSNTGRNETIKYQRITEEAQEP